MNEREIFDAALAMDDPSERSAYLDSACDGDAKMRQHIQGLLESHGKLGSFLEFPALDLPATETGQRITESPGTIIGKYKLLQGIGEGGMGTVFMAEQTEPVKRRVALKIIKPGMDSKQVIARFEAERQALAMMDHPNIAKVLDAGTTDSGRPYFAMELVKGIPITKYCDEHHLTPRERLKLFVSICLAVQHAHQKGVIHRDLKPSNVLVAHYDSEPVPKVIDFGVAKATGQQLTEKTLFTQFGQVVGTLEYMSPEQARFNQLDIDTRSDIYSLGVLLYELLTGVTPLDRERLKSAAFDEVMRIIREEEPPKPSTRVSIAENASSMSLDRCNTEPRQLLSILRGDLDWLVMKALAKERDRRYGTAGSLAADIDRFLEGEPIEARPPSTVYRLRKTAARHRVALATTAIVMLALLIATAVSVWQRTVAVAEREAAVASSKDAEDARDDAQKLANQLKEFSAAAEAEARRANEEALRARDAETEVRRILKQNHELVVRRAMLKSFEGDVGEVDKILSKYHEFFEDDDQWPTILRASAYLHRGDYAEVHYLLSPIIEASQKDTVIPAIAILSTALLHQGEWSRPMELANWLRHATPREEYHDLDQLFLAYGMVFIDTKKAVSSLENVLSRNPNWLICQVILADALVHQGNFSGDETMTQSALEKSSALLELLPDNPFTLNVALFSHKCAIEWRQSQDLPYEDLEANGDLLSQKLQQRFPKYALAHAMSAQYYETVDSGGQRAEKAWLELFAIGGETWHWTAVGALYRNRSSEEMLALIDSIPSQQKDTWLRIARAYVLTDIPNRRQEALEVFERIAATESTMCDRYMAIQIPLLLGEMKVAATAATKWYDEWESGRLPTDTDSEFSEEKLLRIVATEGRYRGESSNRMVRSLSNHVLGLLAVCDGNPGDAATFFNRSIEKPYGWADPYWTQAFLKHLASDKPWPSQNRNMSDD